MPGSNDYSMDPALTGAESSDSTYSTSGDVVPKVATTPMPKFGATLSMPKFGITTPITKPVTTTKPSPLYQQKDFRTEKLASLQGLMSDRRANRLVNRYMKSEEGQKAEEAFVKAEIDKSRASLDAYLQAGKERRDQMSQEALRSINESLANRKPIQDPAPAPAPALVSRSGNQTPATDWLAEAKKYGFNSLDEVSKWQAANGLVADGKFGKKSLAVWNRLQASASGSQSGQQTSQSSGTQAAPEQPVQETSATPQFNMASFAKAAGLNESRVFDGRTFYRYDPDGVGDFWISEDGNIFNASIGGGLGRMRSGTVDASSMPNYERLVRALNAAKSGQAVPRLGRFAKGGSLNRINYFQQGGAAPKQDIKAQVIALVQAAMQGDEKANQQVNQIMEAAKAGNQQAMQLAQLITEVAKQLQGQATAAKWGAKLNYIQNLKFAKGGKTCHACEKKVEMKACGGKKAKKRYFGGII